MDDPEDGHFHVEAGFILFTYMGEDSSLKRKSDCDYLLSILGTITHLAVIVNNISRLRDISSFNQFTLSKSIIIGLVSIIILVWCTPMTFLGKVAFWKNKTIEWILGMYLDSFCYVSIQLCLLLQSLNRFVAIIFTRNYTNIFSRLNSTKVNQAISNNESERRIKRNNLMLTQKIIEDLLFLVDIVNAAVISSCSDGRWWQFLFTTVSWLTVNACDGLVVLFFSYIVEHRKKKNIFTFRQMNVPASAIRSRATVTEH